MRENSVNQKQIERVRQGLFDWLNYSVLHLTEMQQKIGFGRI